MRQSKNELTVIGTLKNKKVNTGTTRNGDAYISIDLTVVSKVEDKINETKVSLWTKSTSKLAKSYATVASEYKTIEEHGADKADRVKIDGSFDMNEYVKDGVLRTLTKSKGVFINRVTDELVEDVAGVKLECVVMNTQPEIKDGKTSGRLITKLYSVGYNNVINEYPNVVVEADLAQPYQQMFPVGTTANFFIRLDNYVVVNETEEQKLATTPMGFGQALANVGGSNIVRNYVNDIVIVGGDQPVVIGKYTQEEIQEMNKLRELAKNEKMQVSAVPPAVNAPTGFGSGFGTGFEAAPTMIEGNMPF